MGGSELMRPPPVTWYAFLEFHRPSFWLILASGGG